LPGAFHRRECRAIDHDALNARIGRHCGQRDVVDLANLSTAIEATTDNAAPEDADVGFAPELHDDA
jgi:hypothetical protein